MKLNEKDWIIIAFVVIAILFFAAAAARAGNPHKPTTNITNITNVSEVVSITDSKGVALAIATAQHNFDWGTHSWQGSVGIGSYNGDAASFAIGKRFDRVLINGSVGREAGKYGYGVGVNWRF